MDRLRMLIETRRIRVGAHLSELRRKETLLPATALPERRVKVSIWQRAI